MPDQNTDRDGRAVFGALLFAVHHVWISIVSGIVAVTPRKAQIPAGKYVSGTIRVGSSGAILPTHHSMQYMYGQDKPPP